MTISPWPKISITHPDRESRQPETAPARLEPKSVSTALASVSNRPSTASTRSKNNRATAPTGSWNTLPKKLAKAAIKFQSTTKISIIKLNSVTKRFPKKAAATIKIPQIIPVAETDVPAK